MRIALKHRQRVHDDLCSELYNIVNATDAKDWNTNIVRLYQTYVQDDKHNNALNQQPDDTAGELSRHLKHVE